MCWFFFLWNPNNILWLCKHYSTFYLKKKIPKKNIVYIICIAIDNDTCIQHLGSHCDSHHDDEDYSNVYSHTYANIYEYDSFRTTATEAVDEKSCSIRQWINSPWSEIQNVKRKNLEQDNYLRCNSDFFVLFLFANKWKTKSSLFMLINNNILFAFSRNNTKLLL